ncbi:portal protein [Bacillus phage DZ1]|uniref:Portal protein n=1 Tax=Bacillus phage DZ1 TaxID=3075862 RepID=A0AA96IXD0_9CAUD|nr:portal protein [Bacillus phage DZ1]
MKKLSEKLKQLNIATVFTQMITAGVIAPTEDWLREELGFPAMSEETKREIEAAKQEAQKAAQAALDAQKANGKEGDNGGNTDNSGGSDGNSEGK